MVTGKKLAMSSPECYDRVEVNESDSQMVLYGYLFKKQIKKEKVWKH